MGFGIPQEIFNEIYQRPLSSQQRLYRQIGNKTSRANIYWGWSVFIGADLLPLAKSESYSFGMPKPITPAQIPEYFKFY